MPDKTGADESLHEIEATIANGGHPSIFDLISALYRSDLPLAVKQYIAAILAGDVDRRGRPRMTSIARRRLSNDFEWLKKIFQAELKKTGDGDIDYGQLRHCDWINDFIESDVPKTPRGAALFAAARKLQITVDALKRKLREPKPKVKSV